MQTGVFLFTDIESSTRRWAEQPDLMQAALERHDRLLVTAVSGCGGTVFKHTGDGVAVAFASARAALEAAVESQRELAAIDWGPLGGLQVRMAIHAGEAEPRDGDWYGPALNRTARLMGIGHGGQVLLSGAARSLLGERLPEGVGVSDLGEHRLRDLLQPESVWQVVASGLTREFPPLRSMNAAKGNLPTQLTGFVGRTLEAVELGDLVLSNRLTTVIGPGGMGKTRLALQTAAGLGDKFPDGLWFVDLAPIKRDHSVDYAAATALEVDLRRDDGPRDLLIGDLANRRVLIVVDNCEHVVDSTADLVESLLGTCPGVRILATSRVPLHVAGEHVWALGPLPAADAGLELFTDRAVASRHGFRLDDAGRRVVVGICERLDGMPLAIELAAARTRSMTVTEVAERLDERFRLLRASRGGVGGRHDTLAAVVAWSYDLLAAEEQQLLDRLSVFVGAFDLRAVHRVCAPEGVDDLDTLDQLDALVERSLVLADSVEGLTRYRLLETIRQYGAGRLDAASTERIGRAHAEYYAALVGAGRYQTSLPLYHEAANLRAAVAFALDYADAELALRLVGPLWTEVSVSLTLVEAEDWARAALALPDAGEHADSRWAHMLLAVTNQLSADYVRADGHARQAIETSERLGLPADARAWIQLAQALLFQGRFAKSRAAGEKGAAVAEKQGRDSAQVMALYCVVQAAIADDLDADPEIVARVGILAEASSSRMAFAWATYTRGIAASRSDLTEAAKLLRDTRDLAQPLGMAVLMLACRAYGTVFQHPDDPVAALSGLGAALEEFAGHRLPFELHSAMRDMLPAFAQLGRYETVAVVDGSANAFAQRPAAARRAVTVARAALGDRAYEAVRERGRAMTDDDLGPFLRQELASISDSRSVGTE